MRALEYARKERVSAPLNYITAQAPRLSRWPLWLLRTLAILLAVTIWPLGVVAGVVVVILPALMTLAGSLVLIGYCARFLGLITF
jgi:hypothetical protein